MQAKKSLGQNFLRDPKILKKIADFAQIEKSDIVVEVGPGEGTLTAHLLERARQVIAIEKDRRMIEELSRKFKKNIEEGRLILIEGDILETKLSEMQRAIFSERKLPRRGLAKGISESFVLVGNIPYYITGEIFRKFLQSDNQPKSLTFVVQKEVADRIMAHDGKESILSISIKAFGDPEYGGIIKAGSFVPRPKVDSAIISVREIGNRRLEGVDSKKFFEILKKGFAHKRKLLRSNLECSQEVFDQCGIPEKARAEDISQSDWICIAKHNLE